MRCHKKEKARSNLENPQRKGEAEGLRLLSVQAQVILTGSIPAEFTEFTSGTACSPYSVFRKKRAHWPGVSVFRERDGWIH